MRNRDILFIIKVRNEARRGLRAFNSDQRTTAQNARRTKRALDRNRRSMQQFGAAAALSGRQLGILSRGMASFAALTGAGLGLVAGVRTLAEFSQEMSTVRAVSGATEEQFQALRQEARDLGATTRFSATEAAQGMTFLARAGFDANESLESVEDTLLLAQAGALSLGSAADIASNVLQGFRLDASDASRVVDVLALTANSANTNVEQLGQAMSFVAPAAAAVDVSVEEASAAVGALSGAGIQATRAGTGLRQIFIQLEKQGGELSVEGNGLINVLETLRDRNLSLAEATDLVGVRQASSLLVLLDSVDKIRDQTAALNDAEGTARRVADTMDDNLNGALLAVRSATEALVLALGDLGIADALTASFRALADALRFMANNADILAASITGLAVALGVAFSPVILGAIATAGASLAAFAATPLGVLTIALAALAARVVFLNSQLVDLTGTTGGMVADFQRGLIAVQAFFNGALAAGEVFVDNLELIPAAVRDTTFGIINDMIAKVESGLNEIGSAINSFTSDLPFVGFEVGEVDLGRLDAGGREVEAGSGLGAGLASAAGQAFREGFRDTIVESVRENQAELAKIAVEGAKLVTGSKDLKDNLDDVSDSVDDTSGGMSELSSFLGDVNAELDEQLMLARLTKQERAIETQLLQIQSDAEEDNLNLSREQLSTLRERLRVIQQTEARTALQESVGQTTQELDQQVALLGLQGSELERARTLAQLRNEAERAGVELSQEQLDNVNAAFDRLEAAQQAERADAFAGARQGLKDFTDEAENLNKQFKGLVTDGLNEASGALSRFFQTGKANFEDFASSIIAGIADIVAQQTISGIATGVTGGGFNFGAVGSFLGGFGFDKGGVVGQDGTPMVAPAEVFRRAKRYQFGSRGGVDTVPAFLSPGETVLTEDQSDLFRKALGTRQVGGVSGQTPSERPGSRDPRSVSRSDTQPVVVQMTVQARDVESFNRSRDEVSARTGEAVNRALRRNR